MDTPIAAVTLVSIEEAAAGLAELIQRALNGEDIRIVHDGRTVARLVAEPPVSDKPESFLDWSRRPRRELLESGGKLLSFEEFRAFRDDGRP